MHKELLKKPKYTYKTYLDATSGNEICLLLTVTYFQRISRPYLQLGIERTEETFHRWCHFVTEILTPLILLPFYNCNLT